MPTDPNDYAMGEGIMYLYAFLAEGGGLTFRDVLADIPRDGPAILVYALTAGMVFLIWRGSRGGSSGPGGD